MSIGEQILHNRYQIQEQLGKKPGRQTFLALDLHTHTPVVIKLLWFSSDVEWDDIRLFERETQVLRMLSHSAIPRYLDAFEVDRPNCKGVGLVQTYIDANSLDAQLKAGRSFNETEIKQIAVSLLEILIYLHQQSPPIIHRDIKPSNILLTNRSGQHVGQVYLVDFGSVQNVAAIEDGTFTIVGTYGYMPPEQFGRRAVPASDLYSLGATLLYLLTGVHPADLPEEEGRIQFEQARQLSPGLAHWLRYMLEPSLSRRFHSAQVALDALRHPDLFDVEPAKSIAYSTTPVSSKFTLLKTSKTLQVIFPQYPSVIGSGWSFPFLLLPAAIALSWVGCAMFAVPGAIGCALSLTGIGLGTQLIPNWRRLFYQEMRLRIDQKEIALTEQSGPHFFKLKLGLQPQVMSASPRHSITKLERVVRIEEWFYEKTGGIKRVELPPLILIWAGSQSYKLDKLTPEEADWLGYHLSDWLELPMQRRTVIRKYTKNVVISISQNELSIAWRSCNYKTISAASRQSITAIEQISRFQEHFDAETGEITRKTFAPSLLVWLDQTSYEFANLIAEEANWLGQQLADWLERPIQQRSIISKSTNNLDININKDEISIIQNLLAQTLLQRHLILQLEVAAHREIFCDSLDGSVEQHSQPLNSKSLIIRTKEQDYELGPLTAAQADWLSHRLSTLLKLPVQEGEIVYERQRIRMKGSKTSLDLVRRALIGSDDDELAIERESQNQRQSLVPATPRRQMRLNLVTQIEEEFNRLWTNMPRRRIVGQSIVIVANGREYSLARSASDVESFSRQLSDYLGLPICRIEQVSRRGI